MTPRAWLALICLGLALPAHAALPEAVARALAEAGIAENQVGVVVRNLDGRTLLAHNDTQAFNPASVMKLVTTVAALDTFGPAHTFKTTLWIEGELKAGVLHGNLIVQGGGDPGLTQERFWLLLRELRQRGVHDIQGDVVLDNSLYALPPADPGAFDQAPLRPYNAPPGALLVNHNTLLLRVTGLTEPVQARLDPPVPGLLLDNRVQPGGAVCNGWGDLLTPRLLPPPPIDAERSADVAAGHVDAASPSVSGSSRLPPPGMGLSTSLTETHRPPAGEGWGEQRATLRLEGRLSPACGERTLPLNLLPPAATAAVWFDALWREQGGRHTGTVREGARPETARLLLVFDSPPLSQLVRDINKFSNNVMAKMLFLNLGLARFGAPATWVKSEQAMHLWLNEKGLAMPELVIENGAGLSRLARLSADSLANLLLWASRQPLHYEFAASLPAIGQEGTQKNRFNGNGLTGRAWLKSGTLKNARNLAGFLLDPEKHPVIVVFLCNDPRAGMAGPAQEALLSWAMDSRFESVKKE